jgi:hypothetical protein
VYNGGQFRKNKNVFIGFFTYQKAGSSRYTMAASFVKKQKNLGFFSYQKAGRSSSLCTMAASLGPLILARLSYNTKDQDIYLIGR